MARSWPGFLGRKVLWVGGAWVGLALGVGGVAAAEPGWEDARFGDIPYDALVGGNEADGSPLFVCHAEHEGAVYPGKVRSELRGCSIGYEGAEVTVPVYQALVSTWVGASGGVIPTDAVGMGSEAPAPGEPAGEPLYTCRAEYRNGLHPGKIRPDFGGCNIGYEGDEVTVPDYEVLVNSNHLPITELAGQGGTFSQYTLAGGADADGDLLFLCLAAYQGGLHPGKVKEGFGGCHIGWGGMEVEIADYQTVGTSWEADSFDLSFPGGDEHGSPLYICHAEHEGGVQLGSYSPDSGCSFGYEGSEVTLDSGFDVLSNSAIQAIDVSHVADTLTPRSAPP